MNINENLILKLPKVELHTHLEGTIDYKTFNQLAKKNSDGKYVSLDECKNLYNFKDFHGFLETFATVNQYIQDVSDLELIIKNYFSRIKHENYRYTEFFLSVDTFIKKGFNINELLEKINQFLKQYSNGIITGINIDFVRDYGSESAETILDQIPFDEYRDLLFGISIGGDEQNYPPIPFKNLFEKARNMGLKTTAHAGEVKGPEAIWETILNLKTDRIGHGISAIKSIDLMNHLKATQTPLEICLSSNVMTNAIGSPAIEKHPIRKLYDHGVNLSVHTDDPGFFKTSISAELMQLVKIFNFNLEELKHMILETVNSSFLSDMERKQGLIDKIRNELERLY
jgi:adenosine deaminase